MQLQYRYQIKIVRNAQITFIRPYDPIGSNSRELLVFSRFFPVNLTKNKKARHQPLVASFSLGFALEVYLENMSGKL
jgi:hypothetical protein